MRYYLTQLGFGFLEEARKKSAPKPFSYDPEKNYISVELSKKSRKNLLDTHAPQHQNVQANHVTLHPPGEPLPDNHPLRQHIGSNVNFHATHHASRSADHPDGGVHAVRVRGLDHLSNKEHKHVTLSTGEGVPAKASNDLLGGTEGERMPDWLKLHGTVRVGTVGGN